MKLFVFKRYKGYHVDYGFATIAARSKEEAEKILADKFSPDRPELVQEWEYYPLVAVIEDFPTQPGLICSDEPFVHPDFTP